MLISELRMLFEEHFQLAKSKKTSKEAKDVANDILGRTKALIDPLVATEDQQKNAINAFKGFLSHRNKELVSKAFEYIDQGHFDALVSGLTYYVDTELLTYLYLVADFIFFGQKST